MLLTFMALSRIKNPEQLQRQKPGEWGKILGISNSHFNIANLVRKRFLFLLRIGVKNLLFL